MGQTPFYNFPSPDPPDLADGPVQILALGQAVEDLLTIGRVNMTFGGRIRIGPPTLPDEVVRLADLQDVFSTVPPAPPVIPGQFHWIEI